MDVTSSTGASPRSRSATERRAAPRGAAPAALLKAQPLFHALDAGALARLAPAAERRPLRRGERVFGRGDVPTGLYVVVYGQIRLLGRDSAGAARLAGVVPAGHSFGDAVLFLERPALVDAEAATDALVLHLPRATV